MPLLNSDQCFCKHLAHSLVWFKKLQPYSALKFLVLRCYSALDNKMCPHGQVNFFSFLFLLRLEVPQAILLIMSTPLWILRYRAQKYHAMPSPGFGPTTLWLRVRRPNHSAMTLQINFLDCHSQLRSLRLPVEWANWFHLSGVYV
jgi:hypothetical protein